MKNAKTAYVGIVASLFIVIFSHHAFSEDEFETTSIKIHGIISQGFLKSWENNTFAETEDGTFQFNEFGVNVMAELMEQLHAGLQIFSRDLGDIGNNELTLDWAYGDYRWRDWMGVRAGKIKIPYGLYNETRDIDMLRCSIFLPASIYYEGNRERQNTLIGGGVYGDVSMASLGTLTYQAQIGDANMSSDGGDMKYAQEQHSTLMTIQVHRQYTADVEWETPIGLRLGAFAMHVDQTMEFSDSTDSDTATTDTAASETSTSASEGENAQSAESSRESASPPDADKSKKFYIVSAEYEWNDFALSSEYYIAPDSHAPEGYYVSAFYRLNDNFEFGGYYSVYYDRSSDKDGKRREQEGKAAYSAWQKEWVASVRFDLNTSWTIKAEGHLINGTAQMLTRDNPNDLKEDSYLFVLKTSYLF